MRFSSILFCTLILKYSNGYLESESYKNPNPRPYDNCDASDLIQLSTCCNNILANLGDCKAGDLACECCALQSMDSLCYNLCPGNPSANFLSVLLDDCVPLNDVNACNIPFKKVDGERKSDYRRKNDGMAPAQLSLASFASSLSNKVAADEEETQVKPKPKLNLIMPNKTMDANSKAVKKTFNGVVSLLVIFAVFLLF